MNKINILNSLKNKLQKLVAGIALFCLLGVCSQVKTYTHIPLKGLFEVLKVDDIGFGHALLHSNWIENMYQYGAGKPHRQVVGRGNREQWKIEDKNDPIANLVRKFWFRASEGHQLLPTQFGCLANIPNNELGMVFGQLINYIYLGADQQDQDRLIDELLKSDLDYAQYRQELAVLWKETIDEEYKLKDETFDLLKKAKNLEQERIEELQKEYKMRKLKDEVAQESKKWGKKKGFSREKKKIESKYDLAGYRKVFNAEQKKIFEPVAQEIQDEYCKICSTVKKMNASIAKKINKKRNAIKKALLDPIKKALVYCKASGKYVSRTVEGILWALFFHQLDDLVSLEEKIQAINDCISCIEIEFKREHFCNQRRLTELYRKEDFDLLEKEGKDLDAEGQVQLLFKDYDVGLHYFIHSAAGKFPPVIAQRSYGYEYEPGEISHRRPNCHEAALLDAFSLLWYNPKKNAFDDMLFPEHVLKNGEGFKRLRDALKYFYLADKKGIKDSEYTCEYEKRKFTSIAKLKQLGKISKQEVRDLDISQVPVAYITRSEVMQEFMNIISDIPGVEYCSEVPGKGRMFELESGVSNIIKEFNYFYGLKACPEPSRRIEQLGDKQLGLSTENRTIMFKKQKEADVPNAINICVRNREQYNYFTMVISTNSQHTSLFVPGRENIGSRVLKMDVAKIILKKTLEKKEDGVRNAAMLALLSSVKLLTDKKLIFNLPELHLLYYSLSMKKPGVKSNIVRDVFERRFQYYDACKEMLYNLIEKFPLDDTFFRGSFNTTIVRSGLHKTESFFQKWIEKSIEKCTPNEFLGGLLWYANDEKEALGFYNEFIDKIEDVNQGRLIYDLIRIEKWPEIIGLLLKREEFAVDKHPKLLKFQFLRFFIKRGYKGIALQIMNNPQLELDKSSVYFESALVSAMEKGYKKIVVALMKYTRFYVSEYRNNLLLRPVIFALKNPEYKSIVVKILETPSFKRWGWSDMLEKAQDKQLALAILDDPRCKLSISGQYLGRAFRWGDREVKLKIVRHPTFKDLFTDLTGSLMTLAVEKGYKEVTLRFMRFLRSFFNQDRDAYVGKFTFEDSAGSVLKVVLEKGYSDIALAVLEDPENLGWDYALRAVLEKGHIDFAVKIIQHPAVDVGQPWVQKIVSYVRELAKKKLDQAQELQKIIDIIELRKGEKKE